MILATLTLPLLFFHGGVSALSTPRTLGGETIELVRRVPEERTYDEWGAWAKKNKASLQAKYHIGVVRPDEKRSVGTNLLVNQGLDSSFYGSIAVGTPSTSYNVILDTGSSDLWLAEPSFCKSESCDTVPTFDPTQSSSLKQSSTKFSITYGQGAASGTLVTDHVQMAGFSVSNQVFAVCDTVSDDLLSGEVSGLMGLAFETIASSKATPFWEALVKGGAWDEPLMAFQLTRFTNVSRATQLEPGGTFTMGAVNTSLYTGDIDYQGIPGGQGTYWIQEMSSLTVQGNSITLPSGSSSYAAIDTGTTLIGGPASVVQALYAQIPGSRAGTGDYDGYYMYPCTTDVSVTMAFGGRTWSISNADFMVSQVSNSLCLGAIFSLDSGNPAWIVGDTFLKNVYSVFRYNPPAVGFADLSETALAMNGNTRLAVPTPTIGSVAAVVSATSLVRANGAVTTRTGTGVGGVVLMMIGVIATMLNLL